MVQQQQQHGLPELERNEWKLRKNVELTAAAAATARAKLKLRLYRAFLRQLFLP
jgi:hypothetical protein